VGIRPNELSTKRVLTKRAFRQTSVVQTRLARLNRSERIDSKSHYVLKGRATTLKNKFFSVYVEKRLLNGISRSRGLSRWERTSLKSYYVLKLST
jgi:hypothetical protein